MSTADGGSVRTDVPPPVTEIAARNGFGALLASRNDVPVGRTLGIGCGGSIACLVVLSVVASVADHVVSPLSWGYSVVHAVSFGLFIAALWLGVYGLRAAILGPRVYYLYPGGVVRRLRSGVAAIAWPDGLRLIPVYGKKEDAGKVLGYRLQARDGTEFVITVSLVNGRDPFVDRIIEQVRRNGGTVEQGDLG